MAEQAERRKILKYGPQYKFDPVVIEKSGVFGKRILSFLKNLACRIHKMSWLGFVSG